MEDEQIVKLFSDLKPLVEKIHNFLKTDKLSYNMIKWDVQLFEQKKIKLLDDLKMIEGQIENKKKMAEGIISGAQEEANRILDIAKNKNVQATQAVEEAKKSVLDIAKSKYKGLKEALKP